MKIYITSTLTADQRYVNYRKDADHGINTDQEEVYIKGGSNISNPLTGVSLLGVQTEITEEQLAILERNPEFCKHRDAGFLVVHKKKEVEEIVKDMQKEDLSAQHTPKKFRKRNPRVQLSNQ